MAQWLRGTVAHKRRWNDTHYSLVISASGPSFVAGQGVRVWMDLDGERVGRPYSLVNPPHQAKHEIFFNIVPDGPLSGELAALEAGDREHAVETDLAHMPRDLARTEAAHHIEREPLRQVERVDLVLGEHRLAQHPAPGAAGPRAVGPPQGQSLGGRPGPLRGRRPQRPVAERPAGGAVAAGPRARARGRVLVRLP